MKATSIALAVAAAASMCSIAAAQSAPKYKETAPPPGSVERGRYLSKTAGCNDCHTAGYAEPAGEPAPAYVPPGQAVKGPVVRFPE